MIPYEKFELIINTKLPEFTKGLTSKTTTRGLFARYFFYPEKGKLFKGEVSKDSFRLYLRFSYLSPPILYGHLEQDSNNPDQTKITVKAKLNPIIYIFIIFWLTFGVFAFETFESDMKHFIVVFTILPAILIYFLYCRELQHTITEFTEYCADRLVQLKKNM